MREKKGSAEAMKSGRAEEKEKGRTGGKDRREEEKKSRREEKTMKDRTDGTFGTDEKQTHKTLVPWCLGGKKQSPRIDEKNGRKCCACCFAPNCDGCNGRAYCYRNPNRPCEHCLRELNEEGMIEVVQ